MAYKDRFMLIDVAICTFRRDSLRDSLRSVAAQVLPPGIGLRVLVADNDEVPSARPLVLRSAAEFGLDCRYLHAPARNISVARNACLDAAEAPFMAFLDDDEDAEPDWLAQLLAAQQRGGADVVFGPMLARYGADAPAWAPAADLHSIRPVFRAQGRIETGYTSNVLIRRAAVGDCRFDPCLGRSGGEDTVFFAALYAAGCRLGYAPAAVVHEDVPNQRLRLRWVLTRAFRSGQVHGRVLHARTGRRLRPAAVATAKALYCLGSSLSRLASPPGWRRYLARAALHVGVAARLLGVRELRLY